ncbi:hypothetical protein M434DRAFT_396021 [Hypoxylon sp. CO27-5]|nr:hypothetical protein M434DRAFT_396021 [Hypoxylon sp. CO27-5]
MTGPSQCTSTTTSQGIHSTHKSEGYPSHYFIHPILNHTIPHAHHASSSPRTAPPPTQIPRRSIASGVPIGITIPILPTTSPLATPASVSPTLPPPRRGMLLQNYDLIIGGKR